MKVVMKKKRMVTQLGSQIQMMKMTLWTEGAP
jgi:hypothetical protein